MECPTEITECRLCGSSKTRYWDETPEEIIHKCLGCRRLVAYPFGTGKLRFYL